jgi:sulfite dehydrogenase
MSAGLDPKGRPGLPGPLPRRRLLAAGVAAGGLALAGCAVAPSGPSIGRVVVVGGGYGGATAARYLRRWGGRVEVTLVERNPSFVSCPMSNLVIGGLQPLSFITRSYDGLRAAGVRLVQDEAVEVDTSARRVRLAGGGDLSYDRLVLAPGIDFMFERVGGLRAALSSGQVTHSWKAGPQTAVLRRQLEAMPDGGVFALTIPRAPYRCPPGPYERACLVAQYLKVAKPRSKVLVLDANGEIQSKKALFERAFREHYAGIVEYRPDAELREVHGTLARLDFEDVKADVLNVVPPQRAGDLARQAGLVTVNDRWVGVDWLTLESTAAAGVHVLGDAAFPGPQMPKSGHMANQQAKVAAAAIVQLLKGEPVNATPVMANTCYSFVTAREAVHVASVHQYDPADRTFKPVHAAGGLSGSASEAEGRFALGWAQNIWRDVLGA